MKKSFIFIILLLISIVNIDVGSVNAGSTISDVQEYTGVEINETEYTDFIAYDVIEAQHTGGISNTQIAYVKFVVAVAKHKDSNTYFVLNYNETDALDSFAINMYHGWVQFYSDVDDFYSVIPGGYGAFLSAKDYEMTQPHPTVQNSIETYQVGVDISSSSPPVIGAVTEIQKKAMEIDDGHNYGNEIFNPKYEYQCVGFGGFDCSYRNKSQVHKGSFKVDQSNIVPSIYRAAFVNESSTYYYFRNSSGTITLNKSLTLLIRIGAA